VDEPADVAGQKPDERRLAGAVGREHLEAALDGLSVRAARGIPGAQ